MTQIATVAYSSELQKQLFPDNSFYKKSIQETGIAADADTFEIPNLSDVDDANLGKPVVLPLQVTINEDTKITGSMKQLYCNPIVITDEEQFVLNYNKRQNKQLQQAASLNTKAADYSAKQWLPVTGTADAGQFIVTTGATRATNVVGLTGNRKAITKADILKAYNVFMRMNAMNIPGDLYALVTADSYTDMLAISDFVDYQTTGRADMLAQGIIGKICGINIMTRSHNGHIGAWLDASSNIVQAVATAASDRPANLFWHSGMVCSAEANPKTYVNENDPTYLGTVLNSSVRFGAEKCRADQKGIIVIAETA